MDNLDRVMGMVRNTTYMVPVPTINAWILLYARWAEGKSHVGDQFYEAAEGIVWW